MFRGRELINLIEQKSNAVINEDYETAKLLKQKIEEEKIQISDCYGINTSTGEGIPQSNQQKK